MQFNGAFLDPKLKLVAGHAPNSMEIFGSLNGILPEVLLLLL